MLDGLSFTATSATDGPDLNVGQRGAENFSFRKSREPWIQSAVNVRCTLSALRVDSGPPTLQQRTLVTGGRGRGPGPLFRLVLVDRWNRTEISKVLL